MVLSEARAGVVMSLLPPRVEVIEVSFAAAFREGFWKTENKDKKEKGTNRGSIDR
jgi:hypothetical protein